jgi:hypothetical protein
MQFFAQRGLAHDISDVWKDIGSNFSEGTKQAATGLDGKQYLVPFVSYPWAIFYRKSVFEKNGYEIPKTLDELNALGAQMQKDGLDPIAFGDKDGWPAMGTFDILNLRINGYDFHMQLMKGEASWEDPKVAKVFDTWKGILPIHHRRARWGAPGRRRRRASPTRSRACTCSACSSASSSRARPTTTSTSSRSRRSTRTSAWTRWTRRSTGSCSRRSRRTSTAPTSCSSSWRPARRRTST